MAVDEVDNWDTTTPGNPSPLPHGPEGLRQQRIGLSMQEMMASIARWRDTVGGGIVNGTTRVTTTYTILDTDEIIFANTDSAAYTATLPAGTQGRTFKVINSGSSGNDLTLAPDGSEDLIGDNTNFTLTDGESLEITYDATDGWY